MKRIIMLVAMILVMTWHCPVIAATAGTINILVLFSYDNQDQWSASVLEGLKTSLAGSDVHLQLEYLDARHHQGAGYLSQFEEFFKTKYLNTHLELAIVVDDEAFNFLLRTRQSFRPALPIVFCGVNNFKPEMIAGRDGITGVNEAVDMKGTVDLALQLFPNASHLIAVAGTSGVGAINIENFRRNIPAFSRKVTIQELLDVPRTSIDRILSGISRDSILLRLDNLREPDGTNTHLQQSIALLTEHSSYPIFSCWDFDMNHGALGGVMVSGLKQGEKAGQLAMAMLKGPGPASIPVVMESPNVPMFDYNQMQRFGIGLNTLPRNAQVINLPVSFYTTYKAIIWATIALFAFLIMCIAVLTTALIARRKAEKALVESEERSRLLSDLTMEGIVIHKNAIAIDVNSAMARMLACTPEDLLGKNFMEFFHEDDHTIIWENIGKEYAPPYVVRMAKKNGEYFFTEIESHNFQKQGEMLRVSAIRDITERQRAEKALHESEQKFRTVATYIHDWEYWMAPDGNLVFVSPSCERITSYTAEEFQRDPGLLARIVHPDDRENFILHLNSVVKRRTMEDCQAGDFRILTRNGEERWIAHTCREVYDREGKNIGRRVSNQDITERMRAKKEKEKMREELVQAQKMEAIGTLAGGIAHDFNNILSAIIGYTEMAYEDSLQGSVNPSHLNQVVQAGHRAKDLVTQILAFSRRADSRKTSLQPAVLVKESIKLLRSSIPTTIDIQQDVAPGTDRILADPTQIHQIVMNLCTNAYHAMEETGGTLSISLKNKVITRQDLAGFPDIQPGRFVHLSVGDTGSGITPEIQERIFDPYFTTKETGKGTGMGLAIVHGIVNSSGGLITCRSRVGVGTVFEIILPAFLEQIVSETKEDKVTPIGAERILFVDDEAILATMGRTLLERLGYKVTTKMSSIEALTIFENQPDNFDLVITDQTMPGMTGVDLATKMLQIRPSLPIILCTGFSSQVSEETARSRGIKGFALKPLARQDIAVLIRKVLD